MILTGFFLSFFAFTLQAVLTVKLPIFAFAPFLAILILRPPFFKGLVLAFLTGGLTDLLTDTPMGIYPILYSIIFSSLFKARPLLSEEQPVHFSLLVGLVSLTATLVYPILLFLFDRRVSFDGQWLLTDCMIMPLVDALYGFVWVLTPMYIGDFILKKGKVFWLKRKSRSPASH